MAIAPPDFLSDAGFYADQIEALSSERDQALAALEALIESIDERIEEYRSIVREIRKDANPRGAKNGTA